MRTKLHIWAGCLYAAIAASNGHAAVIYSNLGPGDSYLPENAFPGGAGAGVLFMPGRAAVDGRTAGSFTTGPYEWSFESAELALADPYGENTLVMSVMTDANGVPGQVLQAVPFSGAPTSPSLVTISATDSLLLAANTTYWIALSATTTDPTGYSGCTWLLNNTSAGDIAYNGGTIGGPWQNEGVQAPALRVNGTIVPEPTAAVTTGWIALLALSRRRRRL
jgi:hypothetical protein